MIDFTFDHDSILKDIPTDLPLDGESHPVSSGKTFDVIDPATDNPLAQVASTAKEDAKQALDDAVITQKGWKAVPPCERSEILCRASELIHWDADKLAQSQSLGMGHALPDSKARVGYGGKSFRWFAEEAIRISDDYRISPGGSSCAVMIKQSVGPVLAITPWNLPLAMGARKITPALAAGCPVTTKSASKTPLAVLYLDKLSIEAGTPAGVIFVPPTGHSADVSDLLSDDRLRKFTFTGSTEVSQVLTAKATEASMKAPPELGGNAPFVTLFDDDVDKAVQAVNDARLCNSGQVCIIPNRFIIHGSKRGTFIEGIVKRFVELKLGEGIDSATDLGLLALRDQQEKTCDLVDDVTKHGAKAECGGKIPDLGGALSDGYFFEPTVLTDVLEDVDIVHEEILSPVVMMTTFTGDDRAIEQTNDTVFGLVVYMFSENLVKALSVAEVLRSGMVVVNKGSLSDPSALFGGVKQSDLGHEGDFIGIDEFLEEKLISLKDQPGEQLARGLTQAAASHVQ